MLRWAMERFVFSEAEVNRFYADARRVSDETIRWLRVHGQERWFLLVHYKAPHAPSFLHPSDGTAQSRLREADPLPSSVSEVKALYEGEVAFWDKEFGRLLDHLEA